MSEEILDQYKELANKYTTIVQKIKDIQRNQNDILKPLKSQKDTIQEQLITFLKSNDSNQIKLDDCKIRFTKRQKTKPIKPENILETTELILSAHNETKNIAESLLDNITSTCEAEREVVEIESLSIVKNV